jgi:hypothetical protein
VWLLWPMPQNGKEEERGAIGHRRVSDRSSGAYFTMKSENLVTGPHAVNWNERRGGRVVDGSGLENRRRGNPTGGSNPSLSAIPSYFCVLRTPCRPPAFQIPGSSRVEFRSCLADLRRASALRLRPSCSIQIAIAHEHHEPWMKIPA